MQAIVFCGIQGTGKSSFFLFRYGINFNDLPAWQKPDLQRESALRGGDGIDC